MSDRPTPAAVYVCPACSAVEAPGIEVHVSLYGDAAQQAAERREHERSPQHRRALGECHARATYAAGWASGIADAADEVDVAAAAREETAEGWRRNGETEGDVEEALAEAGRLRELAAFIRGLPVTT